MVLRNAFAFATVFLLVFANSAGAAAPPSDSEVFNCIRTIQIEYAKLEAEDFRAAKQQFRAIIGEKAHVLELDQLTPYQAVLIGPLLSSGSLDEAQKDNLNESLERAAKHSEYGAAALLLLYKINYWDDPDRTYLARMFQHPALESMMNGWFGRIAINSFALKPEEMVEFADDIERAILAIRPDSFTEAPARSSVARLLDALSEPSIADAMRDHRKRIHEHLLKVSRSTLAKFAPTWGTSVAPEEYQMNNAIDLVEYLEGPAARSELIGQASPNLEFIWSRGPNAPITSLADLKGQVVVLDFWATWCGPCVATFPDMRKLQAHYKDNDRVVIIGVTSIQGYHVPTDAPLISLKDDPERELALMEEYIESSDITWNIAFSTKPVIDPRFDVRGIPHLTIIDPQGRVRHNGLHPGNVPLEEKIKMIDALLENDEH